MSKCWYCDNYLTSEDNPKHFGICSKCYDEMFKSSDKIIHSFINKIADLEAKLEQSQKERELDNAFWKQECDSLQKALADKEKEIEYQENMKILAVDNQNQKAIEQLKKVKAEIDKRPLTVRNCGYGEFEEILLDDVYDVIDNQIKGLKEVK